MGVSLRTLRLALLASLACASLCAPPAMAAAPLWVARIGSDDASGSQRAPLLTLDAALERARPGQTIYVRSGLYPEPTEASPRGRARAPITLRPAPGER